MPVSVVRPDAVGQSGRRSPSLPFGLRRVCATTSFNSASCRSRNLGTAFRSPATTLSPPLRGQMFPACAFDSTLQTVANPFHFRLLRSVRFRGRSGAISSPEARFPRQFAALWQSLRHPLPFGFFTTLRIEAFDRFDHQKLVSQNVRLPLAPRCDPFGLSCGSTLETRFVPLDNRSDWKSTR